MVEQYPTLKFIGTIHSELKSLKDCPRQETEFAPSAEIEIFKEFETAARALKVGEEIIVLTWLHLADRNVLSTIARNDPKNPMTGVFSTRSPDRPNPIGLHEATIVAIDSSMIYLSALEVLDGTPVIDIKPKL